MALWISSPLVANGALGGFFQLQEHLGGGALAAPGLAHDAQRFAGADLEGNAVDGLDPTGDFGDQKALGNGEVLLEALGLEEYPRS